MRTGPRNLFILAPALLVAAGAIAIAQNVKPPQFGNPSSQAGLTAPPVILSGENIGFRVDGYRDGVPVGVFVVRVNDKWVEPKAPPPRPRYAK